MLNVRNVVNKINNNLKAAIAQWINNSTTKREIGIQPPACTFVYSHQVQIKFIYHFLGV